MLVQSFGNEMNVIHKADFMQLTRIVGEQKAEKIISAREGKLTLKAGGGGFYGKAY